MSIIASLLWSYSHYAFTSHKVGWLIKENRKFARLREFMEMRFWASVVSEEDFQLLPGLLGRLLELIHSVLEKPKEAPWKDPLEENWVLQLTVPSWVLAPTLSSVNEPSWKWTLSPQLSWFSWQCGAEESCPINLALAADTWDTCWYILF